MTDEEHRIKTDFFAHQAKDMSSATSSGPLMVVFAVVGIGALFLLGQFVISLINMDKTTAMKYVTVHLRKPVQKDGQATMGVEIENLNPAKIKNVTFNCTVSDGAGAKITDVKIEVPGTIPAGDTRTFPAISLGEIKGNPARMHAELVDLKYGPKPANLNADLTNKFIQASADKPEDAVKEYMEVVKGAPEFGSGYVGLGRSLAGTGDFDNAIKAYQKALKLDPDDENAHYNLGIAFFYKKQLDDAKKEFTAAQQLDPEDPAASASLLQLSGGKPLPKPEESKSEEPSAE